MVVEPLNCSCVSEPKLLPAPLVGCVQHIHFRGEAAQFSTSWQCVLGLGVCLSPLI